MSNPKGQRIIDAERYRRTHRTLAISVKTVCVRILVLRFNRYHPGIRYIGTENDRNIMPRTFKYQCHESQHYNIN